MGKFCGNCGAPLDDDANVCGQCGTPVNESFSDATYFNPVDIEKRKKVKKRIRIIVICFILIGAVIAGINIGSNFVGKKGLIRKAMKAFEEYDISTIVSLSSDLYYYYGDEDEVESYFENNVGKILDEFENTIGYNYKLSYKIDEIYEVSGRREQELFESFKIILSDLDVSMIDKVSMADITVTIKQGERSLNRSLQIIMTKEGKDWKLISFQ
mgnify:CR=1 FL=1